MAKKLIPPEDYAEGNPSYLPEGTRIYHHVDGELWGRFVILASGEHNKKGWFTSQFDQYFYDPDEPLGLEGWK